MNFTFPAENTVLSRQQFGFQHSKGTRDALGCSLFGNVYNGKAMQQCFVIWQGHSIVPNKECYCKNYSAMDLEKLLLPGQSLIYLKEGSL